METIDNFTRKLKKHEHITFPIFIGMFEFFSSIQNPCNFFPC